MSRCGLALLVGLIGVLPVWAKPSPPPPTLAEIVEGSQIVVAEYVGCVVKNPKGPDWYTGGVTADYKLEKVIRGPALEEKFKIRFLFHDGAFCLPTDLKDPIYQAFDEKCMPKQGSRWLLFLRKGKRTDGEPYETFRGTFGVMEATLENIEKVKKLLP